MMVEQLVLTDIEEIVYNWLVRHKIAFQFQTSLMGGYFSLGGSVVDFLLPERGLAWRVHGEYWHQGVEVEGKDLIQKELLSQMGWTVVDIWGQDVTPDRLDDTMKFALQGREVLR